MKGFIDGVDFVEIEPMKYWSFSSSTSDQAKKDFVHSAIFSGEYTGALKVDGFYQRLVKDEDGNCFMIARSRNVKGEVVDKYEWVPQIHEWMNNLPNGTCFLCEAYLPGNEGSKNVTSILGCLKDKAIARQQKTPLHFHIFDIMAFDGKSFLNMQFENRINELNLCWRAYPYEQYVHYAHYFEGAELWSKLQEYLADGREGMVIMRKDAIVYQKRTPAKVSIKVKKELEQTIDCFFTGRTMPATRIYNGKEIENWMYWQSEMTGEKFNAKKFDEYQKGAPIVPITKGHYNGWAGSLEIGVFDKEKVVPIGWLSGVTDEMKADPQKFAMKPIEVTAMELDYSNEVPTLRHGKMKCWRPDLDLADCALSKIV